MNPILATVGAGIGGYIGFRCGEKCALLEAAAVTLGERTVTSYRFDERKLAMWTLSGAFFGVAVAPTVVAINKIAGAFFSIVRGYPLIIGCSLALAAWMALGCQPSCEEREPAEPAQEGQSPRK